MAAPFPEAQLEALIWMALGSLLSMVIFLTVYVKKLHARLDHGEEEEEELEVDNVGLSRRSQELMEIVLEEPELQSDLPEKMEVSKATVSNAVSELKDRGLIMRKKRANTYLIEPDIDELEKQQR